MNARQDQDDAALEVARQLLKIGAVSLSPRELYTWSSGVRSPIYCDNRRILSYPKVRSEIIGLWAQKILTRCPDVQVLAGVATAGIPHAALLAEKLQLPMVYVRSEPKSHGLGKAIEGVLTSGSRTVVIEDLISTAGSLVAATTHLRAAGAQVMAATAIVTYGLPQAEARMRGEDLPWFTLTDLGHLTRAARAEGSLTESEIALVERGMMGVSEQLQHKDAAVPGAPVPPAGVGTASGKA